MEKKRNYGIDLLRIIAGFMIVVLHSFTQGGLLFNCELGGPQESVVMIGSMITYAGVNIFAVISGYVSFFGKNNKTDYSRYIEIWLTVIFYDLVISTIMSKLIPGYSFLNNLRLMLTPVSSNIYWYFTAFTGLYVLKPFIDKGLRNCNEGTLKKLFIAIIVFFSGITTLSDVCVFDKDLFALYRGYSVLWIVLLYIIGYIINRCNIFAKYKTWMLVIGLSVIWLVSYLLGIMIKHGDFWFEVDQTSFFLYISPSTVLTAIILVVIFSRYNNEKMPTKLISVVSPTVFSIYIINCHPAFWNEILENLFFYMKNASVGFILWSVFRFSIIFTFGAVVFDLIRIWVFKLLKVDKVADAIETKLRSLSNALIKVL